MSFGSSAAGTDILRTLFDNSTLAGGKYCKVGKMTIQWMRNLNTTGSQRFEVVVAKHKEGDTAPTIDQETTIRDLRSDGKLVRGPYTIPAVGRNGQSVGMQDTIVLEDLLFDPNDDLVIVLNNFVTGSGTNDFLFREKTWWKVVE